jgi:hypothetical protein
MSGAVKLAVTGVQDQWLTGDPEFSYFLTTFKRHTKFALEQIETPFDGTVGYGEELRCKIPQNKGDLVKSMTVKFLLTAPTDGQGNKLNFKPSFCTDLIETADLYIGGQLIQRLTGEYMYMHQQLYNTIDDIEQTLYFLNGHGSQVFDFTGEHTFFIDLPFYFNRATSLAIPTSALSKQQVEIVLKLRNLTDIINGAIPSSGVEGKILNMSLDTEFVFVSDEERLYLQSLPLQYMISQIQVSQVNFKPSETQKTFMINFRHPVKELLFVAKKGTTYHKIENVKLDFNDMNVFDCDHIFLTYEQPLLYHINCSEDESPFGVYSFAQYPESHYPSGHVNMSRIFHKRMTVDIESNDANVTLKIYAINYNLLHIESGLAGLKF